MADNRLEEAIQILARKKAVEAILADTDDNPEYGDLWLQVAEAMRTLVSSPTEEEIAAAQDYLDHEND